MNASERFHAFDALRAAMMLLGVVLHSATAYSTIPDVWWLKDPQTGRWADVLLLFIHAFRLPTFFVMSGFFAALLYTRRGWQGMLENRMARLGLPFLLGMLFMYPVLKITSVYCWFLTRMPDPWGRTLAWIGEGKLVRSLEPMHLWFLETLMWVCLLAAATAPWLNRFLGRNWFRRHLSMAPLPLLWAVPTFVTLLFSRAGLLDTPKDFSPNLHVVAAYSVFFAFGWGLYLHRDALDSLRRQSWANFLVAAACMPAAVWSIESQLKDISVRLWPAFLVSAAATALMAWFMIAGLIGVFLRHCSSHSPRRRYIADSAYWLYLAHPPVLVAIQVPLFFLPWHSAVKFALGLAFALPVLFWTYGRLVRHTWLGAMLNGRAVAREVPEGLVENRVCRDGSPGVILPVEP